MTRAVLDSSCWIQQFLSADSQRSIDSHLEALDVTSPIVVPTTVIFEVRRWALRNGLADTDIRQLCGTLEKLDVVPLDAALATRAANTSTVTRLGFADAAILATARYRFATLISYDADFADLPGTVVLPRE